MSTNKTNFSFFVIILAFITIGFIAVILPWFGAIFWAVIFAVLFWPLHARILRRVKDRRNLAALITLVLVIIFALIPLSLITTALVQEILNFYQRIDTGQLNFSNYLGAIVAGLPDWAFELLAYFNLNDFSDVQQQIQQTAANISRYAANQTIALGQNTLWFLAALGVMLYTLFFFFRDGPRILNSIKENIPLSPSYRNRLIERFTTVIKATVKGNVLVASIQGTLGGLIFAFLGIQGALLWGVVMTFLSLLPAVGASLIWMPVAIYFFATQMWVKGIILTLFGSLVIGLVDNILRPILVGKSTKLPDWLILITTLGGLSLYGINGFVLGPLMAALFIVCWQLFSETIRENDAQLRREQIASLERNPDQQKQNNQKP